MIVMLECFFFNIELSSVTVKNIKSEPRTVFLMSDKLNYSAILSISMVSKSIAVLEILVPGP